MRTLAFTPGVAVSQTLRSLWLAAALLATAATAADTPSPEVLDRVALRVLETFGIPGMSTTVVAEGHLLHAAGYGISDIETGAPVTAATAFQIASVSKAFTAASLALLVQEGKVAWDAPVIDYLPEFRMRDPWVTREFTVRDLLTHRSGLPLGAGDLLLFPQGNATRQEIIAALRHLKPSSSFRSKYDYDNLMYIVAGEVVGRVAGVPFEEFVERRLLTPLGMDGCSASRERLRETVPRATPHLRVDGELERTESGTSAVAAAAGGINCSASGMAPWMQMLLAEGKLPEGETLIEAETFAELVRPVTLLQSPAYLAEHAGAWLGAYALGWNVTTFHGELMLSHGGALWGMTTFLALLPERGIAVFASNNLMSAGPRAYVNAVLETFLEEERQAPAPDWIVLLADLVKEREASSEAAVAEAAAARAMDSTPSLPLTAYIGRYADPWYGEITISKGGDGSLWFSSARNPPLSGPLEHFQYDTFIARWTDRQLMADAYVSFVLSPEGGVERIRMKAVSPATDFSYDFHDLDLRPIDADQ